MTDYTLQESSNMMTRRDQLIVDNPEFKHQIKGLARPFEVNSYKFITVIDQDDNIGILGAILGGRNERGRVFMKGYEYSKIYLCYKEALRELKLTPARCRSDADIKALLDDLRENDEQFYNIYISL